MINGYCGVACALLKSCLVLLTNFMEDTNCMHDYICHEQLWTFFSYRNARRWAWFGGYTNLPARLLRTVRTLWVDRCLLCVLLRPIIAKGCWKACSDNETNRHDMTNRVALW